MSCVKVCERYANFVQVINPMGDVRICSWMHDGIVGNLLEHDLPDLLSNKKAKKLLKPMLDGTYSNCPKDNCPWLANGTMDEHMYEIRTLRRIPEKLYLAYEGVCNYKCTCCTSCDHMALTKSRDWSKNYDIIEDRLRQIMPKVKTIGANGRGELFASKRIMSLMSEWRPEAPKEECSVELETNGSLFNERNWRKIENLGQYNLTVAITVMSFTESVYRHLSGTKLPIKNLEENLRFVKKLREAGVINFLELATVMQEMNFMEMPTFTRRCIEEFGADRVRIRPIFPGGRMDVNLRWFMDVRNPYHPYYEVYKDVMQDPIFKDPKVLLWSGGLDSALGLHPGIHKESDFKKLARRVYHKIRRG